MRSDVSCAAMMAAVEDSAALVSLVEDFVSGLQDSKARDTATGVKDGQFTILQVVEALGLSLTSTQVNTRGRGVQMLSEVVQECFRQFSVKEVEVLIAFYENRLKDHHVITPHVLLGLKALSKHPALPPGSAVSILRSIFQDVHVQSLMLAERNCVYTILVNLMESRETELKSLGADFVFGFVQSMDGERDPRNLLMTFQIAKDIITRGYDMGKFVEELFEVTSCYFPIDFSPPSNDPHGITQEVLILSLRGVLTGTPLFAEFLLPLIIEKLDSDVQTAKVDSLQTLAACVETYQQQHLAEFLPGLWASLRREVFQTTSEKVETAGLAALAAITSCLSRSVLSSDSEDGLSVFLELILSDCKHHLAEPDLKLVWPSAKLLQAASSTSYRASHIMTAAVIPSLIEQYNNRTQCYQRRTVLEVLQGFVLPLKNSQSAEEVESVLLPFRESLCGVVFSAVVENSAALQITATKVLTALGQHTGLLMDSDVQQAVDHLTRLILEEKDDKVSVAVVECSGALSRRHPAAFISTMIPRLKEHISLEPMAQDDSNTLPKDQLSHHALRQRCLSALAAVSSQPSVVQESTPVLLEVLSSAHTGAVSFSVEEVVSACHSLQTIAQQAQDTEETARCYHDIIIPRLLSLALQAALQDEDSGSRSPLVEPAVLSAMVPVISTVCSRFQPKLAVQMVSRLVSLFLDGDVSCLPDNSFPSEIQLLKGGASSRLSQLVCLLMGCVCSLPRTMEVPQIDRLLSELEELSFTCLHPFSYTSAAKCYAGLLNKRPAGEALDALVQRVMKRMCSQLDSSPLRIQAFTLLLWVAKGLLLRYHPLSTAMTDKLFSLLGDSDLGSLAAEGFSLLMSDSPDVLNRGCHADVRIMYRQRFFTENSAKLVQSFNAAPPEKKSSYLKALSHIVNNLPRQVQLTELPALLHLILEALSCPDQEVQLSTLSCLQPVLLDPPQVLIQQLEALVSRLLALTSSPVMTVRIASLRCIHAVANFPEHEVMPFRARVLKGLSNPLDDKKRLVRSEAVLARGEWFLLGSPGGR